MLELVVKHGESREVLRCVEFVRVLLADSISRWHSSFRTRRSHSSPPPKVSHYFRQGLETLNHTFKPKFYVKSLILLFTILYEKVKLKRLVWEVFGIIFQ